jgi:hypothetical protein
VIIFERLKSVARPFSDGRAFQVWGWEEEVVLLPHRCVNPSTTHSRPCSSVSRPCFPSSPVVEEQGALVPAFDLISLEWHGKEREVEGVAVVVAAGDGPWHRYSPPA